MMNQEVSDSLRHAIRWRAIVALLAILATIISLILTLPCAYMAERGVSLATLHWAAHYFLTLTSEPGYWIRIYGQWIIIGFTHGVPPFWLYLAPVTGVVVLGIGMAFNTHAMVDQVHGSAHWARDSDVRRMKLTKGFITVLGRWRGRLLLLPETLSALCIAPPGTGKTAAIVVPTILTCDNVSMIINDVKPELHQLTSGYRASLGPVFRLDWTAEDLPEEGILQPSWNPLSPIHLPSSYSQRDLYIDRLAMVLVPDPQGSADPHWSRKARAALTGYVHFIIDKCAVGPKNDLPLVWQDKEPCFAMLLDWMTEAGLNMAERVKKMAEEDPNTAVMVDPVRMVLMEAVEEARIHGYAWRAIQELGQLADIPDRERGSILSAMDTGLAIFKNTAVRQRTSRSDFSFSDLRGMDDPRFEQKVPVTIYLCVNQQNSRSLAVITGLFVEVASAFLISHPPNSQDDHEHRLGPHPVLFVLDEFPQMPKLQALLDGPAVGRGQKLSYLMIGQDFGQIEEKYGKPGLETLLSTTAAKIVLPLNNDAVAKRFSEMVGTRTYENEARSRIYGFSKQANPFAVTINKSISALPLMQAADFMSMPQGTHILLMQGNMNCPVRVATPFYFKDKNLRQHVFDPVRRKGPVPALPLPPWQGNIQKKEQ